LFANLRLNIFVYYVLTASAFLFVGYYFLDVLEIQNIYLLGIVLLCFIMLSGVFISKLAVDPLAEYVKNLQNLSKETLHELNLPISTIGANLQMLGKGIEDEKSLKRLSRIQGACDMLKQRYNELDYMIKMQSKQELREDFRVDILVQERVHFLQKIYPQMSFELELSQVNIFSDKTGLSKVIDNIIDNGVKYSQDSKNIVVKLENNSLSFQDFGIGMDEVEIVKIFDQFYQANSSMHGFGIGLSMVKRFCDENDILLALDSSKNVGTKVELKFKK